MESRNESVCAVIGKTVIITLGAPSALWVVSSLSVFLSFTNRYSSGSVSLLPSLHFPHLPHGNSPIPMTLNTTCPLITPKLSSSPDFFSRLQTLLSNCYVTSPRGCLMSQNSPVQLLTSIH